MTTIQIQLDASISVPLAPRLGRIAPKVALDEAGIARLLFSEFALHAPPSVEEWILARARNERELPNLWETVSAAAPRPDKRTAARDQAGDGGIGHWETKTLPVKSAFFPAFRPPSDTPLHYLSFHFGDLRLFVTARGVRGGFFWRFLGRKPREWDELVLADEDAPLQAVLHLINHRVEEVLDAEETP